MTSAVGDYNHFFLMAPNLLSRHGIPSIIKWYSINLDDQQTVVTLQIYVLCVREKKYCNTFFDVMYMR